MKNFKRIISNNLLMLGYIFKNMPVFAFGSILIVLLTSVSSFFAFVYSFKYAIDCFQNGKPFFNVVIYILVMGTVLILSAFFDSYYDNMLVPRAKEKLNKIMQSQLFEKATKIDLSCYDNPKFYTDFVWSTSEADSKAFEVFESLRWIIQSGANILLTGAVMISTDYIGVIAACLTFSASFIVNIIYNKLEFNKNNELKPVTRKRDYTGRIFYLADYAKEVRLTNIKTSIIKNFIESNEEVKQIHKKYSLKFILLELTKDYFFQFLLVFVLYNTYLIYRVVVTKTLSLGDFSFLFMAADMLSGSLIWFSSIVPKFQEHSLYTDKFRTFLDYEIKIKETNNQKPIQNPYTPKEISLSNVSFSYDSNEKPTLKNINITIKPYDKIAIVGYNGAGKSTLIKLLMRLYDTTEGSIRLDGIDIKDVSLSQYRNEFGAVFQDYKLFSCSIAENVKMDNNGYDDANMQKALHNSGFDDKLQTVSINQTVTKEFDDKGLILSGGEAQKVALARVFYKPCSYIILDEPSSALDPISEYNLNKSMLEAAKDKTVIFISHRLSTTKIADKIFMIEGGELIEQGSHAELMQLNGKYANMFHLQAEKYKIG